ncbi:QWRF motif-containing protein 2-like [Carya illinoinensis]|uniref:QWRF motif-containing protein 2 n=1 Tax=Carya illinoinensis TaxID=32201 RepID=A0A8T1QCE4_CARIL|nr:QWRF motif-containing protein 2-like [Carya illinoinensis]KAG6652188.1 hypothetical protein CIPAW_06G166700 [Carya illinoinensis]
MVAAVSEAAASTNPKTISRQEEGQQAHTPLLPPEKDNGLGNRPRRPRGRQVSSRYMSPSPSISTSTSTSTITTTTTTSSSSTSRRFLSPLLSRSSNSTPLSTSLPSSTATKRSQSVDRRRPITSRPMTPIPDSKYGNAAEVSAATKLLVTSTRSLSVSFQGEAFSLPISKTKAQTPSLGNARKGTPERRRGTPVRGGDQVENSKPLEQHRWPGRTRQANSTTSGLNNPILSRSLDFRNGVADKKIVGVGSGKVVRAVQNSMVIDESRRASFDGRLSLDLGNAAELLKGVRKNPDANSVNESSVPSDLTASDTDSVSSGSTSGVQDCGGVVSKGRGGGPRGIFVSARFWQETNSRLRRLQDPGSPISTSPGSRMAVPAKSVQSKKFASDGPLLSPRTMDSPIRGATRPASPSRLWTSTASSPSRGMPSPSRVRNTGSLSSNPNGTPSILSFSVDIRRGKMGEDRIVDAHLLRLLHNRYLQWRFANARADAIFMMQKLNAEKNLWNAWVTISELRHTVTLKRIKLLLLRQKLKLASILRGQMNHLEEWSLLDRDHSNSLQGATEALRASTFRLPIVGKAVADIQNLKDALGSAVDVMQAMASSMYSLLSKVEDMNSLATELVKVTAKEQVLLEQSKDFLSALAAMQVKDCSLRTHMIQLNRVPTTSSLTTRV